jgi:predicted  nucleic acid-binding Zn-ribbon protein
MACDPADYKVTRKTSLHAAWRGLSSVMLIVALLAVSASPAYCQTDQTPAESAAQTKATDAEVVEAANEVDGVNLSKEDMAPKKAMPIEEAKKQKKKGGFSLNPLNWLYEPISDMQETIVKLEQQIVRLEGPIAGLQKPMLGLRRDLKGIDREIEEVRAEMSSIGGTLGTTVTEITATKDAMNATKRVMGDTRDELAKTKSEVVSTKNEIRETKHAVTSTKREISDTTDAVIATKQELLATNKEMRAVHKTISQMGDKLNNLEETVQELRGPIRELPKPVAGVEKHLANLESNLRSLRESVNMTSNLILAAILLTASMVCFGTPVMALLAFKYRKRILEGLQQQPTLEDDSEATLATATPKTYTSIKPLSASTSSMSGDKPANRSNSLRR